MSFPACQFRLRTGRRVLPWGAGLATESARALLAHGFGALGLQRVTGRVDTPNRASVRVLERLGMEPEGEKLVNGRPTLHFALSRPAPEG